METLLPAGGASGGGILPTIIVTTKAGTTITCTKDNLTILGHQNGTIWTFEVPEFGTWSVQASKDGRTKTRNIEVDTVKVYSFELVASVIYGYRVKQDESAPYTRVEYLADAVGMTPGYMDYTEGVFNFGSWANAFFVQDNRPCMVKYDGSIDYWLNPDDYTKKENGENSAVANTSYEGNAMSAFPLMYFKRYTEGNYTYTYVSDYPEDADYHAYAHTNSQGQIVPYCFHAIFEGSNISSKLRSLSGQTPINAQTGTTEETYAQANNSGDARWHIRAWAINEMIYDLLTLMGKSTNLQEVYGQGHSEGGSDASSLHITGLLNTKGQFWGSNTTSQGIKVFHCENFYTDRWERMVGLVESSHAMLALMDESQYQYNFNGTNYTNIGSCVASNNYVSKVNKTQYGWIPTAVAGSETTYYCDYFYQTTSGVHVPLMGGACDAGGRCGRSLAVNSAVSNSSWAFGASLSLVPPAFETAA